MENCSVFYYESQQACQVHGLVGTDDSSPYIRQIDVNTLDMRIAQVNAARKSECFSKLLLNVRISVYSLSSVPVLLAYSMRAFAYRIETIPISIFPKIND